MEAAVLGIDSLREVGQALVNGLANGGSYALVGLGVALILSVTGRFHFAFATTYALTAVTAAVWLDSWGLPGAVVALVSLLVGTAAGVACEALVYRPVERRSRGDAALPVFVAALGLTIAGENAMRLVWGADARSFDLIDQKAVTFLDLTLTNVDLFTIAAAVLATAALSFWLRGTVSGREIRAVRVNRQMAVTVGIDPERVFLLVFAVGSVLGGVAALLSAVKFASVPEMGTQPFLYGFVVAFLAGLGSPPLRVMLVGFLVGVVQSMGTIWVSVQLSTVVVFGLLIAYVSYLSLRQALLRYSESPARALLRMLRRPITTGGGARP
jgi:branched-subunit amino acid ABC-type transport system permease component